MSFSLKVPVIALFIAIQSVSAGFPGWPSSSFPSPFNPKPPVSPAGVYASCSNIDVTPIIAQLDAAISGIPKFLSQYKDLLNDETKTTFSTISRNYYDNKKPFEVFRLLTEIQIRDLLANYTGTTRSLEALLKKNFGELLQKLPKAALKSLLEILKNLNDSIINTFNRCSNISQIRDFLQTITSISNTINSMINAVQ